MRVSVNMVVRNEEMFIKHVLRSVLPYAGEVVLIDNGSTDSTLEKIEGIAEKVNTPFKIEVMPDCEDIAFMRNATLANSQYEWVLIADGDEVFYNEGDNDLGPVISRAYLHGRQNPHFNAVTFPFYHFYGSFQHIQDIPIVPAVRLIRNDGTLRWFYPHQGVRLHETPKGVKMSARASEKFAHYGYCKPNQAIHSKGVLYRERGWQNELADLKVRDVTVGAKVCPFFGEHPSAMQDFPFEEFVPAVREENGSYYIAEKSW